MPDKTVGGVPVSDSFAEANQELQDRYDDSNPPNDVVSGILAGIGDKIKAAFDDPNVKYDDIDMDQLFPIPAITPTNVDLLGGAPDEASPSNSDSGSPGSPRSGSAAASVAPTVDPLAELITMLKANTKEQVGGIRDAFAPQIQGVRDQRKRSRKELDKSAEETLESIRGITSQLTDALSALDGRTAATRGRTDSIEFDDATRGDLGFARELADTLTGQLRGISQGQLSEQQALTQTIRQAGRSRLVNNSAQLLNQLRTQRAQQLAAVRAAGKDAIFNLKAGQVGASARSGGGGGGFRGSSSSGDDDDLSMFAQLAADPASPFYGQDPRTLKAMSEAGILDNDLTNRLNERDYNRDEDNRLYDESVKGKYIYDGINGGTIDPSDLTVDERVLGDLYGTRRNEAGVAGAGKVADAVAGGYGRAVDALKKQLAAI